MKSELEVAVRALLEDSNVPDGAMESALNLIMEEWVAGNRNLLSASWRALMRNRHQAFELLGPRWKTSQKRTRVSRIISLSSFLRYFTRDSVLHEMPLSVAAKRLQHCIGQSGDISSLIPYGRLAGVAWPQWVTLQNEIEGRDSVEVLQELGTPSDWVSPYSCVFEYTIESSHLHTPTVLDASLGTWFVSKNTHPSDIPRAWSWKNSRWGLPEFVHSPASKITDPTLRLLSLDHNNLRAQLLAGAELFACYSQAETNAVEQVVRQILMQVSAHEDLQRFIGGKSDILNLAPLEFERFVATLYNRRGFRTTLTKASRDGGFDVIAFSNLSSKEGILIQAKKVQGTVGISVIRELIGARFLTADYGNYMLIVATSGRFSSVARKAERAHSTHLELRDYRSLQEELRGYARFRVKDIAKEAKRLRRGVMRDNQEKTHNTAAQPDGYAAG